MSRRAMRWIVAMIAIFTPAVSLSTPPGPIDLARLDGFASGLAQSDQFAGVVLIAERGRIVFEQAYGKRDQNADDAATTATRYNLASAGKMFTSVAVWQQIAAERLTLDTRVGDVLKTYHNRALAAATVRQLLTHTAGAGEIDVFGAENADARAHLHSLADFIARYEDRPPSFAPGSGQDYSNYGYILLGRMIEIVSGDDFESYVRRHIFAPAGMAKSGFVDCAEKAPDIAIGYAAVAGKSVANCATQPARGLPAGGELSTAHDMFLFVRALQTGRLIPPALFAQAIAPYRAFMGLGFFATDYGKGHTPQDFRWGHGGSSDGACADIRTYPIQDETVIVLANRDPPGCFAIANYLHKLEGETGK